LGRVLSLSCDDLILTIVESQYVCEYLSVSLERS